MAAIPEREDPRDVIIARDALKLTDLPRGARIGTGSPRRMAQLNAYARTHGMDIETVPIRGNVDTRIGYVTKGDLDAVVLAAAGLNRVGRSDEVTDFLSVDTVLPAPARGTGDRDHRGQRGAHRRARPARRPVHPGRRDGRAVTARRPGGRLQRPCRGVGRPSGRRADCQGNAPARSCRHDRRFHAGAAVHHRSRARDARGGDGARSRTRHRDACAGRGRSDGERAL